MSSVRDFLPHAGEAIQSKPIPAGLAELEKKAGVIHRMNNGNPNSLDNEFVPLSKVGPVLLELQDKIKELRTEEMKQKSDIAALITENKALKKFAALEADIIMNNEKHE